MKIFSDDLYEVIKKSAQQSRKYYQTFCGTPHLFLAMFSTLSQNKDNERYKDTYNSLRSILNKYNVDGQAFQKSFLEYFPKGEDDGTDFSISVDDEFKRVSEGLKRDAMTRGRSMEIEDLIMALFEDKAYNIHMILSNIIGSDMKTDEMYDEIIKAFKPKVIPEVKEFEEMDELTNLNKWLKDNPQMVIDADEPVMKIEMALSGRSIKNCVLTGPAGTGKTTYVYEFVQRINNGNVPEMFADKIVYQLDAAALIAGTR